MLFDYDNKDCQSILDYAKRLEDMTFREIVDEYNDSIYKSYDEKNKNQKNTDVDSPNYIYNSKAKGQLGGLLENCYFGYKPNSNQEADFSSVGIELKQTCIDITKKGTYRAGERLSITNISYKEPVEDNFYKSHVWEKIKKILLIHYIRDKTIDRLDYIIKFVNYFSPPEKDLKIIIQDYKNINNKIKNGKAHELSESDTLYLGACTKGANAKSMWVPQYYGNHEPAKRRNYCFKNQYMNYILQEYILKDNVPCESIIENEEDLETKSFEEIIIEKILCHKGKSDEQLCKEFDLPYTNNKAQWNTLSFRMLGIKGNHAEEFIKAGIEVKTIRLEKTGVIKESMSFSHFRFKELASEEWEDSTVFNYFDTTKFLFVLFKSDGNKYYLDNAKFWQMPYHDLNVIVKQEWEMYQDILLNGVIFEKVYKKDKIEIKNNLPGSKDTQIIHIRPHAQKSAYKLKDGFEKGNLDKDGDELPNGEWMTKQSFWLNSKYVIKQVGG